MPPVRRRQDYGLWLRCCARCPTPTACPSRSPTTGCRPASLSGGKLGAAKATWTLYREVEGLGRARAGWYLAHNLARAALKRTG